MLRQTRRLPRQRARRSTASWTRTTSSASAASRSSRRTRRSPGRASRSTSSTRPATPTSAARSSARSRWSTACCCWSTPPRGRCRRRASCSGRRSSCGLAAGRLINKIDRADARVAEVLDEVFDLFIDLGADEEQLDFPVVYTNARAGHGHARPRRRRRDDLRPLFETIVEPSARPAARPGRADAVPGEQPRLRRLRRPPRDRPRRRAASCVAGGQYTLCRADGTQLPVQDRRSSTAGTGSSAIEIDARRSPATSSRSPASRTSTSATRSPTASSPMPLPPIRIDEPTIAMIFGVNTEPVGGPRGQQVTSRKLRERLFAESAAERQPARRGDRTDRHLPRRSAAASCSSPILIETMRREGFELQVSKPTVVMREQRRRRRGADGAARRRRARGLRRHRDAAPRRAPRHHDAAWTTSAAGACGSSSACRRAG